MGIIASAVGELENVIVRIYVKIKEGFSFKVNYGWALAKIVKDRVKLQFLGDQPVIFNPGMPITVHVCMLIIAKN